MSIAPMDQLVGTNDESNMKPRVSYTREFLLSLVDKDVCKKLPNLPAEFNDLLFRDSQDPSPERHRISGDFVSHGLRRNDYSSSPPSRGEFGSNSRGSHGRWEGRSGGWNDKDPDSHSDRDPGDPGRRSGMPSRRPWQAPEHDGLLGKGSFPKPPGFSAGPSGPRPQSNDSYQLSRTNEPYHPPRPYKAAPYTRRDTRDSLNDETFGSSDSTSEDRAEEERKRRASFELLRKEHQKVFQERQKSNPDLRKNDFDFTELLGESKDEKERPSRSDEVNNNSSIPGSNNHSFPSQSNAPRPLVPPGFASTVLDRKQGDKPQAETSQHELSPLNPKGISMVNGTSVTNEEKPSVFKIGSSEMLVEDEAVRVNSTDTSEQAINLSSFLGISTHTVNKNKSFEKLSSISAAAEVPGHAKKIEQTIVKLDQKSLEISDEPSILDKIFNTAINLNSGDKNITQKIVERVEETRSPQTVKSSKFAHLFLEEDNKPVEDLPSNRPPGGLLSLLQGADKLQTFDTKAKGELSMDFPYQGHATKNIDKLSNTSATKSVTAAPPVLTCEDLEQSILSEVSESYPPPAPVDQELNISSVKKTNQRKTSVDNQASQHLLSLLQRSADPKSQDALLLSVPEGRPPPSVKPPTAGEADPGKSLTLENLFGSAFMNELQSIGEPVSGRAVVSDAPGVPLRSERSIGELSQINQTRPDGFPGGLLGFPEDGNLLAVSDPANPQKYMSFPGPRNQPEVTFNISDKLAALNSGPRNERPIMGGQDGPFLHHHPQQYTTDASSNFNGSSPVVHPHVKPQLDFMGQGSIITQHQGPPPNHQFPPSMIHRQPFHHSATSGLPEFDRLPPHMMQKMHMQDNLQHHHQMQGFPGGGPPHHHSPNVNNQMPGLSSELNLSQGFPFAHRQPSYGMPPPGSQGNRVDHPASLQTLLGIQQRMDPSKQSPAMGQAGGPNRQGSIGQELDLGFGYR